MLQGEDLPETVTLKNEVTLALMMDGKAVGTMKVPAGKEVKLIQQTEQGLEVAVGAASGTVLVSDTDFEQRLAQLKISEMQVDESIVEQPEEAELLEKDPIQTEASPEKESMLLEYKAEDRPGSYNIAEFRMWHPDINTRSRAVLVLVPGANGDGRGMAGDRGWQEMAEEFNWLIIACYLKGASYQNPEAGSGDALFDALTEMGIKIDQPGLEDLPFVMWGISAGGQFNYNFAQWKPEQVVTFVVNKGAYYTSERDKKARKVPALFFIGMKDKEVRIKNISGIFFEGREKNAPWALIREPNEGHGVGASKTFSRQYFRTVFPLRLPAGEDELQEIEMDQGYLGDLETFEVEAKSLADGDPEDSSWLPTQDLADQWKSIVAP